MKKHLYIVEGKTDVSKLKTLGIEFVLKTDGFNLVSRETYNFIQSVIKVRPIVLLLDPDGPGKRIASKINEALSSVSNRNEITIIEVDKHLAIAHKKVGIAQMKITDLLDYLKPFIEQDEVSEEEIRYTINDLIDLKLIGENSKIIRSKILTHYPVNISTSKKIIESLNILQIDKEELRRTING